KASAYRRAKLESLLVRLLRGAPGSIFEVSPAPDPEDAPVRSGGPRADRRRSREAEPAAPFEGLSEAWSRPLRLSRVLEILGQKVPGQLSARRFRDVLSRLGALGLEIARAGEEEPLARGEAPEIEARVRLRRAPEEDPEEDGLGDWPARERVSPVVRVVPGAKVSAPEAARPLLSASDYELSVLR